MNQFLGSFERFIGILLEEHGGNLPIWLAPVQVVVSSIVSDTNTAVEKLVKKLKQRNIRAEADIRNEKINYKVREHSLRKVPIIIALGNKEVENETVTMRRLGSKDTQIIPVLEMLSLLQKEVKPGPEK